MDQNEYNARVMTALKALRGDDDPDGEQALKAATAPRVAYKSQRSAAREADQLEAAIGGARIGDDQAEQVWDVWTEKGWAPAAALLAQMKAERALNSNGLRDDQGLLIGAPLRDAQGNPLR